MDALKPPGQLKLTGNVDANWKAFKQQFLLYLSAVGVDRRADERKIAMLLTVAGTDAIEVFNTFVFAQPEDRDKFEEVLKMFDGHCLSKKNETYERYVFRSRVQHQGETFDNFLTDLKLKAQTCNFGDLRDSMVRDQIVFGTTDKKLREKLLRETELTLGNAIKICQASELARQLVLTFNEPALSAASQDGDAVHALSVKGKQRGKFKFKDKETFSCKRCGEKHKVRQCPAYGKTCAKCKGKNHYAKMCFSKDFKKGHQVHAVTETDDSDDLSETFFIKMVSSEDDDARQTVSAVQNDKWMAPLLVNETIVTFRIDWLLCQS